MDFDIVPYPLSPTEGERKERAEITKRFGDAWSDPGPSHYFRPIVSTMASEMDKNDDDDLVSIASSTNEVISTVDIFSKTAVLQQSKNGIDDNGKIGFVNVIGLEAEDLPNQDSKKNNK